jgi:hemolysin activation/secretion protein
MLRGAGTKVFGDAPFQESAFIGGYLGVRTLDPQRYAGDAALNGTAELQFSLAHFALVLPLNVGVFGFADAGRVYVNGLSPGGWHTATGMGLWLGILNADTSISVEFGGGGNGLTGARLRTGMTF